MGWWMCTACRQELLWVKSQSCYLCGTLSADGASCDRCRRQSDLAGLWVACHFEDGPIRQSVHSLKYDGNFEMAGVLAGALAEGARRVSAKRGKWVVSYVPLHPARQALRGYNQSRLLAQAVATRLGIPMVSVLAKTVASLPQAELDRAQRLQNVRGSFKAVCSCAGAGARGARTSARSRTGRSSKQICGCLGS